MENRYTLRYLPLFEEELTDIVRYVTEELFTTEETKNIWCKTI